MENLYFKKYIKYKSKYVDLKNMRGGGETYFIHDNGGQPFKVIIDHKKVKIYNKKKSNAKI
uniref:Uncharacterized protein n=1 Tax=viral metagenome TaxID=1070528 RepID=A0A6C0C857_9ZZZZ